MKIKKMSNKELYEERKKCINNPYYFFTNYVITNGQPATTPLNEYEFNELFKSMIQPSQPFNSIKLKNKI